MLSIKKDQLLSEYTTFGIGGPARFFAEASTMAELQELVLYCSKQNLRYMALGKGSNTLFDDKGFDGLVILNKISFCDNKGEQVYVGAGYSFSLLGVQTARGGFSGLEFASGIPGSVGGAVYMNAGANGGETFDALDEVTFVREDGSIEILPKKDLQWSYRFSSFQEKKGVIAAAKFKLVPEAEARKKQLKIVDYRTKTQPYGDMSAGCVFRNAKESSAGALIEKCGLKGFAIGGAEVSTVHANFIVNKKDATAQDVMRLARHVQENVKEKTGIDLEMEVRVIPYL